FTGAARRVSMHIRRVSVSLMTVALLISTALPAGAHGLIGQRFFPATLKIDDPFVADELSLPTVSFMRFHSSDEGPGFRQWDISGELSKRLSPDRRFSPRGTYPVRDPPPSSTQSAIHNMRASLQ